MNVWVSVFIIKTRLSLIVRANVVLKRTVVVDSDWRFDILCGSHLQSQSELYHVSWWYYTLVKDLIGQLRRDVIGRLSVTALFTDMRILKFKSQLTIAFFAAVNHLNGPLRKQNSTLTGSKGHGLWSVIGGFRSVCDCNYDWRQRKTQLWRRILNFRVSIFVKNAGNCWLRFSGVCSKLVNQLSKVTRV